MHSLLSFFKSRQFFIHLALIIILVSLSLYLIIRWMSTYTNHGEFVMVPDFKGRQVATLEEFVKDKDVNYQIIDSVYDPKEKPGIVLRQDPEMNSKVKHNRTVYLSVTGMVPPQVEMPKLIDRSERQARLIISSYGLKLGRIEDRKADCNGCVLEQLVKNRHAEPGQGIPKGSVVDLVIGRTDAFLKAGGDSTSTPENESIK